MSDKTLITNLIDEWKPRKSLAEQIKANPDAVHKWARFNRIPSEWQAQVVSAAQSKGLRHITADWMLDAHSREVRS